MLQYSNIHLVGFLLIDLKAWCFDTTTNIIETCWDCASKRTLHSCHTNYYSKITHNQMITYDIIIEHLCTFNDIYQEKSELLTAMKGIRHLGSTISLLAQNQMELLSVRIKTNAKLHTWLAGEAARAFACHPRCTGFCWNPCPSQVSLQDNLAIFGLIYWWSKFACCLHVTT